MKFAPNQVELAKALGVHRTTVARWIRTPGNPGARPDGRLELTPWKDWAERNARTAPLGTETRTRKERLEEIQLKRLEHRLRVEQRQHIPVKEVARSAGQLRSQIERLAKTLHRIAGDLEGRTRLEIETRLRAEEDRLINALFAIA